jgi:hypothetical protein
MKITRDVPKGSDIALYFMTAATIIAILIVWFMPKRLTSQEIYSTWIVMALLTRTSDQFLDQVFNLYDQLPQYNVGGTNCIAIVLQNLFPPAAGVMILNFMPKVRFHFIAYTMGVTLFSVVFEWITIQVGYLFYYKWSLWYSALVYFFGTIFLRFHLSFLRKRRRSSLM